MGGFFGAVSDRNVALDVFFGTDYHSHLGTRRGGMVLFDKEEGFQRQIHNIENTPFRTKFERDLADFRGHAGLGCISDSDPQPLLVRSHLGTFAITTIGAINNAEALVEEYFEDHDAQFMALSSGAVNSTELVAALINQKDDLVAGIQYAQSKIDGSLTLLIMTEDGDIIAARDFMGRLPVLVGADDDGHCVAFESFAYHKLGYHDEYELGPAEIVRLTPDAIEVLSPARDEMKMCAFMWVYYGYPNSNYEGVNVETMRYRNGAIMARDEEARNGQIPDVDYVAGVPDSGLPHGIGYATETNKPFARPFIKAALLHAEQPGGPQPRGEDEADPRAGTHQGQETPVRGRLHRARHPAWRDGRIPLRRRREGSAHALRLPAHHVQLQVPELLQLEVRHGAHRSSRRAGA